MMLIWDKTACGCLFGIKGKSQIMVSSNKVETDIPVWAIPFNKSTQPPLDDFSVSVLGDIETIDTWFV